MTAAALMACGAAGAHANPFDGVPNPGFPDGTGDSEVDRLNRGQLAPPPAYGSLPREGDRQPVVGRGMYGAPPAFYAPSAGEAAPVSAMPPGLYGAPPAMYGALPPND